jgi:hypothetical protein
MLLRIYQYVGFAMIIADNKQKQTFHLGRYNGDDLILKLL